MADQPKGKAAAPASRTSDRTGALVAAGMVLLAMIGVGTIFSEQISAALSPVPSAPAPAAISTPPPPSSAAVAPNPPGQPRPSSGGDAL